MYTLTDMIKTEHGTNIGKVGTNNEISLFYHSYPVHDSDRHLFIHLPKKNVYIF